MFKNSKLKKYISSVLAVTVVAASLSIGFFAYGNDIVRINAALIPDYNLRKIISSQYYDKDGNGWLSSDEIASTTELDISGNLEDMLGDDAVISTLQGIDVFTSATILRCGYVGLDELDVIARMPQLKEITCQGNDLVSVDISKNVNLEWFNCAGNMLTSIDVSKNKNLIKLQCENNSIASLDVSMLTGLTELYCYKNELSELNLTNNTALKKLMCSNNHIAELDLSANTGLGEIKEYNIGKQKISAKALTASNSITVEYRFKNYQNIVSTSLDRVVENDFGQVDVLGYNGIDFVAYDVKDIDKGIDYDYNVGGLGDSENMSVHIDVERDFYQVNFYTDESRQTRISYSIINPGESVTVPDISDNDAGDCQRFAGWSEDVSNVTCDMDVYAVWGDNHDYTITEFKDGWLTVSCPTCGADEVKLRFMSMINARRNSANYQAVADANHDGVINTKDFALLTRDYDRKK